MSRVFERFFTRHMSLFSGQYWYLGEAIKTREMTKGVAWYEPLFLYEPNGGVSVYYETIDGGESLDNPLVTYFRNNPTELDRLGDVYLQQCQEMREIVEGKRPADFHDLFQREADAWPHLAMAFVIGASPDKAGQELADKALHLRSQTDTVSYVVDEFMFDLALRHFDGQVDVVHFLTKEEIVAQQSPPPEELEARRAGYALFEGILYPRMIRKEFERRFDCTLLPGQAGDEEVDMAANVLPGRTAYEGVVRGRVRIVNTIQDLPKFQAGEILVSCMTTPTLMSAIHHASAIVTDEGGITCHAAIVSRELKIPCITGTRNATKVLKDGDEVEVDATKGIVIILKRASV